MHISAAHRYVHCQIQALGYAQRALKHLVNKWMNAVFVCSDMKLKGPWWSKDSKVHRIWERHQFYYAELRKLNKVDGNLFLYLLWVLFILRGINIILYL